MTYESLAAQGITRLYLAGPMTGLKDNNHPAFNMRAEGLRKLGFTVFNPAETFDGDTTLPLNAYMRINFPAVMGADAIAVLDQWELSVNARREVEVARACAIPVLCAKTLKPAHEEVTPGAYAKSIIDRIMRLGLNKHDANSWKKESHQHHILRGIRHGTTALMHLLGVEPQDAKDHLHNALSRYAMAAYNVDQP